MCSSIFTGKSSRARVCTDHAWLHFNSRLKQHSSLHCSFKSLQSLHHFKNPRHSRTFFQEYLKHRFQLNISLSKNDPYAMRKKALNRTSILFNRFPGFSRVTSKFQMFSSVSRSKISGFPGFPGWWTLNTASFLASKIV